MDKADILQDIKNSINELDINDTKTMDSILDEIPNSIIATYFERYSKKLT